MSAEVDERPANGYTGPMIKLEGVEKSFGDLKVLTASISRSARARSSA